LLKPILQRCPRFLVAGFALLTSLTWAPAAGPAGLSPARYRQKGQECEKRGAWLEACRWYDEALRRERGHAPTREAYLRCLRRVHQEDRHRDPTYRQTIARLSPLQALEVYKQVLLLVSLAYVDRAKTNPTALFGQGLQELRLALDDPFFRRHFLAGVRPAAINAFRARLASWPARRLASPAEARDQLITLLRDAQKDGVLIRPSLVAVISLEFAAGACNALDEYSSFLTPRGLAADQAAQHGRLVGVGLDLGVLDDRLVVSRVYPRGPAQEAGLLRFDRVVRIDRQGVEHIPAEVAAERLRGEPGSAVELEVVRHTEDGPLRRVVRLVRRAVHVPSVEYERQEVDATTPIGYLRITHFQDSTLEEVKVALEAMQVSAMPLKGLILDLRGNPGGAFESAVAVADLFLGEGIIVYAQSPVRKYNRTYKAEPGAGVQLPLVVLVDGETASAAEVLAAALKDRTGRAPTLVVGQTTYGKGSVQQVLAVDGVPLDKLPAGIRLTVARLFSPANQAFSGRGLAPQVNLDVEGEAALRKARDLLLGLLASPPMAVARGGDMM
jgi:carboxyl-terminal processing protease